MPETAEATCKVVPVALEDAAHLGLREEDVAELLSLLRRDPLPPGETGRTMTCTWRDHVARYAVHVDRQGIVVYLLRINPPAAGPEARVRLAEGSRRLSLDVIRSALVRILTGGI